MRIRSIKPEFRTSQSMGNVSRGARLLFILMFTIADDDGRLGGNHRFLCHELYPFDDDVKPLLNGWIKELVAEGCIREYQEDRGNYITIVHWKDHQKIDHPRRSKLPAPPKVGQESLPLLEGSPKMGDAIN